jgi:formylmethanofuran dehydrogenase subunit C
MAITLELLAAPRVPLEVEGVVPERVRGMALGEIERLEVFHGNVAAPLAEFFRVSGDAGDGCITWQGDLSGVHWVGAKMASGSIRVEGNAGRHVGSDMTGGEIVVEGNAGDWVGGEMHGGLLHVRGNAGHLVGAAYRGSRRGMTGGTILIGGSAGNEVGHTMRRGLIAVSGTVADLAGFNMWAGTLLVFGSCGIRPGAGMRRGTIGMFDESPPLLPTFRRACRYRPLVLELLLAQLRTRGFTLPDDASSMHLDLYHGDLLEGGRGEILVKAA